MRPVQFSGALTVSLTAVSNRIIPPARILTTVAATATPSQGRERWAPHNLGHGAPFFRWGTYTPTPYPSYI